MVPEACTVSGLPSDAHRHILPSASTIAPSPPAALVSLETSWNWCSPSTCPHINGGAGGKGGETNEELVCPTFGEGQGETSNSESRKASGRTATGTRVALGGLRDPAVRALEKPRPSVHLHLVKATRSALGQARELGQASRDPLG